MLSQYIIIILLFSITLYFYITKKIRMPLFVLVIVISIMSIPILNEYGMKNLYDVNFHTLRYFGLANSFNQPFPYRINYVNLYGGQDPIMYPYVTLYVPVFISKIFHIGLLPAVNIAKLLLNLLTGFLFYYSAKDMFDDEEAAFYGSIVYVLYQFGLSARYVVGATGEILAYCVAPLLVCGFCNIYFKNYKKWWVFVIAASLMFQSHMMSTVIYFMILVLMGLIFIKNIIQDKNRVIALVKAISLTVFINLWTLVPIIYEILFVDFQPTFKKIEFNTKMSTVFDFSLKSHYNLGPSVIFGLSITLIYILIIIIKKIRNTKNYTLSFNDKLFIAMSIIGGVVFYITFNPYPVKKISEIHIVKSFLLTMQHWYRLYVIFLPLLAMQTGYVVKKIVDSKSKKVFLLKLALILLITLPAVFKYVQYAMNTKTFTNIAIPISTNEYCLSNTSLKAHLYDGMIIKSSDNVDFTFERKDIHYKFNYKVSNFVPNKEYIEVPLFAYPVYRAYDENNNDIKIARGDNNLIRIYLDRAEGYFEVNQYEPWPWFLADILSFFTLLLCAAYLIRRRFFSPISGQKSLTF